MTDGIIELDSDFAKTIGFTSDKFDSGSYLWRNGNRICISIITAVIPGNGDFRRLIMELIKLGVEIAVPTPSNRMKSICLKHGFKAKTEIDNEMGPVDMLILPAADK